MSILIDLSYINSESKLVESVALYAIRLLDGFKSVSNKVTLLVAEEELSFFNLHYPYYSKIVFPKYNKIFKSIPYFKGIYKMIMWRNFVNTLDFSVIYIPFSWIGNSPKAKAAKVITIHDLRPMREVHSTYAQSFIFRKLGLTSLILRAYRRSYICQMNNADSVITISNYVKNDILNEFPCVSSDKLHTIYNGVVLAKQSSALNINYPYVLYVNTLSPHKNIETLIQGFKCIYTEIPHKIIIVGKDTAYWEECVAKHIKGTEIEKRIVRIKYCSNEELRWLYEHASLFVTTSTREGFGYTPIEAAICCCPVLSTVSESLEEVTAGILNYYDPPTDIIKLSQLMKDLLLHPLSKEVLNNISLCFRNKYDLYLQVKKINELLRLYVEQ